MKIKNTKIALVTGATGGVGTAICRRLAEEGYTVAANFRNAEKANIWQAVQIDAGYDFKMYEADVSDFKAVGKMIHAITEDLGDISVLVNNAGITRDGLFRKMSPENFDLVMKNNLYTVFNCSRQVINRMIENGFGRIINMSSVNAQKGQFGKVNYSAAKAGMHGFTKSLAMEVADRGVTVNTVSAGYLATDMMMAAPMDVRRKIISEIPTGRLGKTEEVAHLVAFLASDQAGFITGANYAANGGQHVF